MPNQSKVTCPNCGTECLVTPDRRCYCATCAKGGVRTWLSSSGGSSSMRASVARNFARPRQPSSGGLGGLSEMAGRLTELQQRLAEAEARGEDTTPKITYGFNRSSTGGVASPSQFTGHRYGSGQSKKVSRQEPKPPLESYSINSWKTEEYFAVLIEGVETPNWRDHSAGVSVSVKDDVLRIVDTRKGAPQAALTELVIPEEYDPSLYKASSWGEAYKKG